MFYQPHRLIMNDKLEMVVAYFKAVSTYLLNISSKTTTTCENSRSPGRNLNPVPSEKNQGMLNTSRWQLVTLQSPVPALMIIHSL
jgi:hypothetical protein